MYKILDGALFISDVHHPHHSSSFLELLMGIEEGRVDAAQLFLIGDIFDLLFGHNSLIYEYNKPAIDLLNLISERIPTYYFEGNHDFVLKDIFAHIKIFERKDQPAFFTFENKRVAISHGDRYATKLSYELYTNILRRASTLKLLRPFEKIIIPKVLKSLKNKDICHDIAAFEQIANLIDSHYDERIDLIIEGHFHQAKIIQRYISLPSLACQNMVAVAREGEIEFKSLI